MDTGQGAQVTNVAIIGAGPYGLSIAAHLRELGVDYRIFGRPLDDDIVQTAGRLAAEDIEDEAEGGAVMIVTADNPVPREVVDGIVAGDGFHAGRTVSL